MTTMAKPDNAAQPLTKAAFRPAISLINPVTSAHGVQATHNTQRFLTPVKFEFKVPSNQHAFNLNKAHLAVLNLIKDKDPSIEIVPSKEGQNKFADLAKFPATEEAYSALFHHAIDKQPTEARKVIVKHSILTNQKFSDLKFQNAKLMDHLFTNKIFLSYNQSDTLQVAALGFMQGIHPRVTHREGFVRRLQDAIQMAMTEAERLAIKAAMQTSKPTEAEEGELDIPDIKLDAITRTIGHGNGDGRVKTEAFEIRVPLEIRLIIKEILTRLATQDEIPDGRFIPYGLVQTVGEAVYKKMLCMQNEFLTAFRMIPVFGLTPTLLQQFFNTFNDDGEEHQTTVQHYILSQKSIASMETTNRANDLGKIFLISDAAHILDARAFVDNVIPELFASGVITPELIHPNFNPPRRGDAKRTSPNFQSYATALANLGNPQDDATISGGTAPPPRPAKRNVQMVYDLQGDFPNLPRRHNTSTQKTTTSDSTTANQSATQNTPAVTQEALTQLRAELKKEFQTLIQTEVKAQIKTELAAIQAEVGKVGLKLDAFQENIRDSIGSAIREAMQASLPKAPPPNPQQQQQQYLHEASLQAPVHNLHSTQNNYASPASTMNYSTPNYYEPLNSQTEPVQTFDPNYSNSQEAATQPTTKGPSPMETGVQQ